MTGIWHSVVLGTVLSIPLSGAATQDKAEEFARVLTLGDPDPVVTHRLTAQNLRARFAVDRELRDLSKQMPDLADRTADLERRLDPEHKLEKVTLAAKVHEGIPEIAQILRTYRMSGREYVLTHMSAMMTAMLDETFTPDVLREQGLKEVPPELMTRALKFWKSMDAALKAEAEEWKKAQGYDRPMMR